MDFSRRVPHFTPAPSNGEIAVTVAVTTDCLKRHRNNGNPSGGKRSYRLPTPKTTTFTVSKMIWESSRKE
ncbi:hypothetical protein GMSM_38820 [Geomonas sp. Red276]